VLDNFLRLRPWDTPSALQLRHDAGPVLDDGSPTLSRQPVNGR
jgi:hypothetical protein